MAKRRKAREALLRALYLCESREMSVDEAFAEMETIDRDILAGGDDPDAPSLEPFSLGLDAGQKEFALVLGRRIAKEKDSYNEQITSVLENWDFSRIARIDRIIMWIAIAEMTFMLDIPVKVSINEALELAKKFSSEKSSGFINGVLDAVARNMDVLK